jgi:hypothetical protein
MPLIDLDLRPPPRVLRLFGLGACVFAGAVAALGATRGGWPPAAWVPVAGVGLLSAVLGFVRPGWNRPLYLLLTVASYPLGLVVSYLVLAVLFYGVLTPVGLLFRLLGRDPLRRRRAPAARSNWQPRTDRPEPERYFRQF